MPLHNPTPYQYATFTARHLVQISRELSDSSGSIIFTPIDRNQCDFIALKENRIVVLRCSSVASGARFRCLSWVALLVANLSLRLSPLPPIEFNS